MRILLVEEAQWASDEELRNLLKNSPQIDIVSCGFERVAETLGTWDIDCIVIDACRGPNRQVSTESDARNIRKIFKGPMIAISNGVLSLRLLKEICQYGCVKGQLPTIILGLISKKGGNHELNKSYFHQRITTDIVGL